ncbi:MAG: DNA-methyltransferase [Stomatobaculum sp.]
MQIITSDALEALRRLPDECCSTCVTSPPYFGLRDYGVPGQLGLEENPDEYVGKLVKIFREVLRVLRDDGTLWLNMGDSYATRSGNQPPTNTRNSCGHTAKKTPIGYKYKDLIGIPWLLAFALRADGWYLRADIIWQKPNAMPESCKDRPTRAHEYVFLLSKAQRYYYDAEAIKEPAVGYPGSTNPNARRKGNARTFRGGNAYTHDKAKNNGAAIERESHGLQPNATGKRNRRSVWTIATRPHIGAHFATFPEDLVRPCILAGSKKGDTVLDPFMGSGTTGAVAIQEGRDFIGIEINPEYSEMSRQRITAAKEGVNT